MPTLVPTEETEAVEAGDIETRDIETRDSETRDIATRDSETRDIATRNTETSEAGESEVSDAREVVTPLRLHHRAAGGHQGYRGPLTTPRSGAQSEL